MEMNELERELNDLAVYIQDLWRFYPTPLAYLNPQGTVLDVDSALVELLGLPPEALIGSRLHDFSPRREEILSLQAETIAAGSLTSREAVLRDREGKEKAVEVSTMVRKDEEGNVIGYFIALIDVSERKKAEALISESNRQLKEKINELETFYKVAVGRENKMIDLEQEVDDLLKELGRPAKYTKAK